MTTIHLIDHRIVRGITNAEILILRIGLVGANNLVQRGSTVNHRNGDGSGGRILTRSRDRVGGLRSNNSRHSTDSASSSIQSETSRKRSIGSTRRESIHSGSNIHVLETPVDRIRSFRIAEGGWHGTIAHHELNLVQIDGSSLSTTKGYLENRIAVSGGSAIELRPFAGSMCSNRRRKNLREQTRSRIRSLNNEGSRVIGRMNVGPNSNGRDGGNKSTTTRVCERCRSGGDGRICVASPRN